jgi:conjugal transfer/type IV secretion protein DotA/TraY
MHKYFKFLLALLALTPIFAMAGPFDPPSTDISLLVLAQIFGGLMPNGGINAFGDSISTFNGAVLMIGGILATYTILAGTLGTAHDGEMLGKKFSSVWIPIRYSLGTALVLPVLPGGYCIMQQLVMWVVIQGVGLADTVWTSYLGSQVVQNSVLTVKMNSSTKENIFLFAKNVALAQICTQANAYIMNPGQNGGGLIDELAKGVGNYDFKYIEDTAKPGHWNFGDFGGKLSFLTKSQCGSADLIIAPPAQTVNNSSNGSQTGKLGDISSAFKIQPTDPIYVAHGIAGKVLITALAADALTAVKAEAALPLTKVQAAATAYATSVENAGIAYANGDPFAAIIANSRTQGWFLAGAWFTKLTMLNRALSESVNTYPSAVGIVQVGSGFKWLDAIQPKINAATQELLVSLGDAQKMGAASNDKDDSKGKSSQNSSSSWISKLANSASTSLTGIDMQNLQNDPRPAILILQDAGNKMIDFWAYFMAGLLAVSALSGVMILGTGFNSGPLVFTIIGFLAAPIMAIVGIGFTLAFMLPNLPFLMWLGIILGWIIMVVEAILAAPLWAVMHLHPNGDDLTGRGGNGYMMLLGLLLRPVLTIFGLIAALVLTDVMGEFVNKVFFSVFFTGPSPSGFTAILIVVFAMSTYTMAMIQLFKKTFSLMHVIPDQLLRWIGGGQEQMGQYAGGMSEAAGKGVQAAGQGASFMGDKTLGSMSQGIQQHRAKQDQDRKALQNKIGAESADKTRETELNSMQDGSGSAQMRKEEALAEKTGFNNFKNSQNKSADQMKTEAASGVFKQKSQDFASKLQSLDATNASNGKPTNALSEYNKAVQQDKPSFTNADGIKITPEHMKDAKGDELEGAYQKETAFRAEVFRNIQQEFAGGGQATGGEQNVKPQAPTNNTASFGAETDSGAANGDAIGEKGAAAFSYHGEQAEAILQAQSVANPKATNVMTALNSLKNNHQTPIQGNDVATFAGANDVGSNVNTSTTVPTFASAASSENNFTQSQDSSGLNNTGNNNFNE